MGWREFTMPRKYEFDTDTLTQEYGKFTMEPFERGYALTLGNALRRGLLSSIESAAPVSVKIDGVLHEFGTMPGVLEDVMDVILAVRQLRLRVHGAPPKTIRLEASGECEVTAKNFEANPEMEILNPGLHIATLTARDAKMVMEVVVDVGRGYSPAERNRQPDAPIGVIPLDANFSPVSRVRFDVENTRVGQVTDYERLVLEIWTDGRVTPEKALDEASFILREHFALLVKEGGDEGRARQVKETERLRELVLKAIDEMDLSVRAKNSLHNENINTIGDLVSRTDEDLLKFKNLGRKSLDEIKETLGTMGLSLGMDVAQVLKADQN